MSALPPKADIDGRRLDVRFVPLADSCAATKYEPLRRRTTVNWVTDLAIWS
jgi:hypothetical protein